MSDKVYCYPDSEVLVNKLNIRNIDRLHEAERRLTMLRLDDLLNNPIKGNFDLKHLQSIHKYLFQDVYEWAGKIRLVDIAKSNMFCKVQFIDAQANEIFGNLKFDNFLNGISREEFVEKSAYYFSEINALHPFREGNGRAQREFVRELALHQGYRVCFADIDENEMLNASIASFICDYEKMERLFEKVIR